MHLRHPDQRYVVAAVYVAAMLMNTLDSTIVNVALVTLGREFDVPPGTTEAVVVAYLVSLAVFIPAALLVPAFGGGLTALWGAMALMMATRMLTLWLRSRSGLWIVTGATR